MPNFTETTYQRPLQDGLALRTAVDERDVERVAEFNGLIHKEGVVSMTRSLLLHHPNTHVEDLIFVEDEQSGQVVSSLCLIPWTWRYEDVEILSGELGIVGTLEAYRHRGLIRAQMEVFKRKLRERGCLLSQIQGIPYYYRQFGYEYALPLEGGLRLETRHVPETPEETFTFRLATIDDIPTLMQCYDQAAQDLVIHAARDGAIWRYLLTRTKGSDMEQDVWIVQGADEKVVGYFCIPKHHFGEELVVSEVSQLRFDAALAVLNFLKELTVELKRPGIRLNLPAGYTLAQVARSLGAHDLGTYAWQIHVPDAVALLRALVPVLERRVAGSPFAGLTKDVRLDFYRETILLCFQEGKLTEVQNLGFNEGEVTLRCPPLQFIPLALGYRTLEELRSVYPDVGASRTWQLLVETLFPKVTSFIHTIY